MTYGGARATAVILGALLVAACGGSTPLNCPNDLPASCPSPPPSYRTDVAPIISARCLGCHAPGKQEASKDFTTYPNVFSQRQPILTQVFSCRMPPEGEPRPTAQERAQFLAWLVCGAPDN
jgi:hypothetical protein